MGPVYMGEDVYIADTVVIGHPGKEMKEVLKIREFDVLSPVKIGDNVMIRDDSIIYSNVSLGSGVETGHHVLIREGTTIGEKTSVGSGAIIEANCRIGNKVSLQSGVYLSNGTIVEDGVFLGPNVCITNDKHMDGNIEPSIIREGAKIGAGTTILAGVEIGKQSLIGAGSLVNKDVPAGATAYGVPARSVR